MALVRVWHDAKKPDQCNVVIDPLGKQPTQFTKQENWCVVYDGMVEADSVVGEAGLPTLSTVPGSDGYVTTTHQPVRDSNNPYLFNVLVIKVRNKQPDISGSPVVWNKSIQVASSLWEETATEDRLGLPLWNTAGELLDPLPTATRADYVYTITWTQSRAPTWGDIGGRTNDGTVNLNIDGITDTWTKSQAKVMSLSKSVTKTTEVEGGAAITKLQFNCSLTIQVRKPKWVWRTANRGWRGYIDGESSGEYVQVTFRDTKEHDTNQDAPPSPTQVDLDAKGKRAADGAALFILPDDAIGEDTPNSRDYVDDGAFELELQCDLGSIIGPLND